MIVKGGGGWEGMGVLGVGCREKMGIRGNDLYTYAYAHVYV